MYSLFTLEKMAQFNITKISFVIFYLDCIHQGRILLHCMNKNSVKING